MVATLFRLGTAGSAVEDKTWDVSGSFGDYSVTASGVRDEDGEDIAFNHGDESEDVGGPDSVQVKYQSFGVFHSGLNVEEFNRLTEEWQASSAVMSSPVDVAMLPAYQRIIGMGIPAVPHILQSLESSPSMWFWALKAITGADPVRDEDRGFIPRMVEAWIRWGHENGYEW